MSTVPLEFSSNTETIVCVLTLFSVSLSFELPSRRFRSAQAFLLLCFMSKFSTVSIDHWRLELSNDSSRALLLSCVGVFLYCSYRFSDSTLLPG